MQNGIEMMKDSDFIAVSEPKSKLDLGLEEQTQLLQSLRNRELIKLLDPDITPLQPKLITVIFIYMKQ